MDKRQKINTWNVQRAHKLRQTNRKISKRHNLAINREIQITHQYVKKLNEIGKCNLNNDIAFTYQLGKN